MCGCDNVFFFFLSLGSTGTWAFSTEGKGKRRGSGKEKKKKKETLASLASWLLSLCGCIPLGRVCLAFLLADVMRYLCKSSRFNSTHKELTNHDVTYKKL